MKLSDYRVTFDDDFEAYLEHYGVKGMKWGVRNEESRRKLEGRGKASFKTKRMAKKDAKEYATAKMYYGEGAGNRRKLIKNQVEQRRKDRPGYSEEFDRRMHQTNWDKTVSKAKGQRKVNTAKDKVGTTSRSLVRQAFGNPIGVSTAALAIVGGWKIAKNKGWDKKVVAAGEAAVGQAKSMKILAEMMWKTRRK